MRKQNTHNTHSKHKHPELFQHGDSNKRSAANKKGNPPPRKSLNKITPAATYNVVRVASNGFYMKRHIPEKSSKGFSYGSALTHLNKEVVALRFFYPSSSDVELSNKGNKKTHYLGLGEKGKIIS